MDEPRESDLLSSNNLDLVDLSAVDDSKEFTLSENGSIKQKSSASKGFCVKDYEQKMDNLKKENFNLKLKLYFFEQKNPNVPEGIEHFQKEFIELKHENEALKDDLKEKQDLLQQASLALELLEEEKLNNSNNAEMIINELKSKIMSLEQENSHLQQVLSEQNKAAFVNDTGFTDFLGAVDIRDIEMQRKLLEVSQISEEYKQQVQNMNGEMEKIKNLLKETESKMGALKYERDEMADKFRTAESEAKLHLRKVQFFQEMLAQKSQEMQYTEYRNERLSKKNEELNEKCECLEFECFQMTIIAQKNVTNDHTAELSKELQEFKEKWAATQCELNDVEKKLQESENERQKTIKYLKESLQTLDQEQQRVLELEALIDRKFASGMDKEDAQKDAEIHKLKEDLHKCQQQLKLITSSELNAKSAEIENLTALVNKLKIDGHIQSETPKLSFDYIYETINDPKFQQAMEIKKQSQLKINQLVDELVMISNSKTKERIKQLKSQIQIVSEKQEVADNALNKCVELCNFTLDHLHDLAQFLTSLMQNREIRESLGGQTLINIQNILDKSVELSRMSIDGRISGLPDLSMFWNGIAEIGRQSAVFDGKCGKETAENGLKSGVSDPNSANNDPQIVRIDPQTIKVGSEVYRLQSATEQAQLVTPKVYYQQFGQVAEFVSHNTEFGRECVEVDPDNAESHRFDQVAELSIESAEFAAMNADFGPESAEHGHLTAESAPTSKFDQEVPAFGLKYVKARPEQVKVDQSSINGDSENFKNSNLNGSASDLKNANTSTACQNCPILTYKFDSMVQNFEELKRVNQLLEDEICEYRETLNTRDDEIKKCQEDLKFLKETEMEINAVLEDCKLTIEKLQAEKCVLENGNKELDMKLKTMEMNMKIMEVDKARMEVDWMPKVQHEAEIRRIRDEVVNAEAQAAAIRMELDSIKIEIEEIKKIDELEDVGAVSSSNMDDFKPNHHSEIKVDPDFQATGGQTTCQVIVSGKFSDIHEHRHNFMSTEAATTIVNCKNCPKYKAQAKEMKMYLEKCFEKLKVHSSQKAQYNRLIEGQLFRTEDFLHNARVNMENILKSKENKENF